MLAYKKSLSIDRCPSMLYCTTGWEEGKALSSSTLTHENSWWRTARGRAGPRCETHTHAHMWLLCEEECDSLLTSWKRNWKHRMTSLSRSISLHPGKESSAKNRTEGYLSAREVKRKYQEEENEEEEVDAGDGEEDHIFGWDLAYKCRCSCVLFKSIHHFIWCNLMCTYSSPSWRKHQRPWRKFFISSDSDWYQCL